MKEEFNWQMSEYKSFVNELEILLNVGISISISERGNICDRRNEEASGFFMKQVLHAYTMLQIVIPQYFPQLTYLTKNAIFHDFCSVAVIVRAMFETMVNMVFITINPTSEEEFEFKKDLWDLHALCERRKIGASIGSQNPDLLKNENDIDYYINKIQTSIYLTGLSREEKQSINSKLINRAENFVKWTKETVLDRAKYSGLHENQSEYIYKITSAYAHSESFGIMQLLGIQNEIEPMRLTQTYLHYTNMLLAFTINKYSQLVNLDNYIDNDTIKITINKYVWLAE